MKQFNQQRSGRFSGGFEKRKPAMMHKATCNTCGKTCEVPFRPTNGKPVYCKDCFDNMGGNPYARDDKKPARFESRDARPEPRNEGTADLKRQLEMVNSKLDKLISFAETLIKVKTPKVSKKSSKS